MNGGIFFLNSFKACLIRQQIPPLTNDITQQNAISSPQARMALAFLARVHAASTAPPGPGAHCAVQMRPLQMLGGSPGLAAGYCD